jgi:polyisoprenoid-binding protein YceI
MINRLFYVCLIFFSSELKAQIYATQSGKVEFFSEATVENFTGVSTQLVGQVNLADSTLDFYVDTNTLSTGIKLRDEHMRENHLNTEEFPFIEFFGKLHGYDKTNTELQQVKAIGRFTIRGKTQEIEVNGTAKLEQGKLNIDAKWIVKLADYDIPRPKFLFLKLSEEQKISLKVQLEPQTKVE